MHLQKQLGKLKFELKLSGFQIGVIATWIFFLLVVPISIDQLLKSQAPEDSSAQTTQTETTASSSQNEQGGLFTYTVNLSDQRELISLITLIFGSLSALIAVGSLVFFLREQFKKEPSVFDS